MSLIILLIRFSAKITSLGSGNQRLGVSCSDWYHLGLLYGLEALDGCLLLFLSKEVNLTGR